MKNIEVQNQLDRMSYEIFDYCDSKFNDGLFEEVNNKIPTINIENLNNFTISSWLSALGWAKHELSNYNMFKQKCYEYIKDKYGIDKYESFVRRFK